MRALAFFLIAAATVSHGQVITTVAGGPRSAPASNIPALSAPIYVRSVAVDPAGNLYVTDQIDNVIGKVSPSGTWTIVAGNGIGGFSGDGGPATSASLFSPSAVAFDAAGNLYIADTGNQRIRMVSNGVISTIAGNGRASFTGDGGPATAATLNDPTAVAVDANGNLYIADTGNNWIREVSAGTITRFAGAGGKPGGFSGDGGPPTSAQLNGPLGIAVDANGAVYIADTNNHCIRRVSGGTIDTIAGVATTSGSAGDGGPATSASLSLPEGIALDSAGNLYIADAGTNRIRLVSNGTITTLAGSGAAGFSGDGGAAASAALNMPMAVAVDSGGRAYIADINNNRIRRVAGGQIDTVAGNGNPAFSGDGGAATAALLLNPQGIATDGSGNLYIADTKNNRIRRISHGIITTVAGNGNIGYSGDGGPAVSATLRAPAGVAVDGAGNIYIADTFNFAIRRVSNGTISTVAGNGTQGYSGDGGPAVQAWLNYPQAVAIDAGGNLYIADTVNSRVRRVANGVITTFAGTGNSGFSGDGGAAASAQLMLPGGVALDSSGNVYIADTFNNRIRRVSNGVIRTVAGSSNSGYSGDGGPALSAGLAIPEGIALDTAGNLYIADSSSNRVRVVSNGMITTLAGIGPGGFAGDGGPAAGASLTVPMGVATDAAGNVYIADTFNDRIRAVGAGAPAYRVSTVSLSPGANFNVASGALTFAAAAGSALQNATLSFTSPSAPLTFNASVNSDSAWLSVTPVSGAMPAILQISADPGGLAAGTYNGTVLVTVPNGSPAASLFKVTLAVVAANAPKLGASLPGLTFSASQASAPLTQSLQILNTGGGSLPFTATITSGGGSWLSLSAQNGTATAATPASLTVTATPGSLAPGTYSGTIVISGAGTTLTIPVTLSISPPAGTLLLSQNGLTFNAVSDGGAPLAQLFGVLNTGQGSLTWTASASTLSGGEWLQISPTSGSVQRPFLDFSAVNATVRQDSRLARITARSGSPLRPR